MSRDFKKKPIWPALSSGSKRKGRPPFHSLRSFHYEHPFLSLAADAAFTETMLRYPRHFCWFSLEHLTEAVRSQSLAGSHRQGAIPFAFALSNSLPTVHQPLHTGLINSTLTVSPLARERAVAEIVTSIGRRDRSSDQLIRRRNSGPVARYYSCRQGKIISSDWIVARCSCSVQLTKPRPQCRASVFVSPKANP